MKQIGLIEVINIFILNNMVNSYTGKFLKSKNLVNMFEHRTLLIADYYQLLGVSRDVSAQELKKAYLKSCLAFHPDKHPECEEKFKEIKKIYDVLSDPKQREIYDAHLCASELNRTFDVTITPQEGKDKLNRFFAIFFIKRGYRDFVKEIKIEQRQSTTCNPKGLFKLISDTSQPSYQSWHFLEIKIKTEFEYRSKINMLCEHLNELFFDEEMSSEQLYGFTYELRRSNCNFDDDMVTLEIDIHLTHAIRLEKAIEALNEENTNQLLNNLIRNKLEKNSNDVFALAARSVISDLAQNEKNNLITHAFANNIRFQTYKILQNPTEKKVKAYKNIIVDIKTGNRNLWKIIGGSIIAFLGITAFLAGVVSTLTGAVPLGIPLKIAGTTAIYTGLKLVIIGLGLNIYGLGLANQGKTTGLRASLGKFLTNATKHKQYNLRFNHSEQTKFATKICLIGK